MMCDMRLVHFFGPILALGGAFALAACPSTGKSSIIGEDDEGTGGDPTGGGFGGNGGAGAGFLPAGGGDQGGSGGIIENPCGSECGPEELCDGQNAGSDDNCDGIVDEGCPCAAGAAQACFKGDPSYRGVEGCFDGSQKCNELGFWGECTGGVHATEMCFQGSVGCHPIQSPPFLTADLSSGLGNFGLDAVSELYDVACPAGVTPCPAASANLYTPLQSGEYTVTYTKTLADNSTEECVFPLFVGAPGLRVELTWEWDALLGDTADLDLHMHRPGVVSPWGGSSGNADDCAWTNCDVSSISSAPTWFPAGNMPPDPVNWWKDPVMEKNTCYYGPDGSGAAWQALNLGCHNPRLDSDNIDCDPTETDPTGDFCNPENINIDFPSTDWTRIGVHYFSAPSPEDYDLHPTIKIFCDGALAAELGPEGYDAPVTFTDAMGSGSRAFWLVADVAFYPHDECDSGPRCEVRPVYADEVAQTPLISTDSAVSASWVGSNYPPPLSP